MDQTKAKKGLIVTGVIAGASSLILLNKNTREKVIDRSKTMKDSVSKYATTIKEDPQGTKDAIVNRIQNATEISQDAINKIQNMLDKDVKVDAVLAKDELLAAKDDVKYQETSEHQEDIS